MLFRGVPPRTGHLRRLHVGRVMLEQHETHHFIEDAPRAAATTGAANATP